ncbi:hypothetical protein Hanom_Chr17g01533441 [Helianthus anomalus]
MQNYYRAGVSLEAVSLFLRGRGMTVYILPSSDPTLALLLVRFKSLMNMMMMRMTTTLRVKIPGNNDFFWLNFNEFNHQQLCL